MQGHSETIFSVVFSPDGRHLASGSDDNTIKLWNLELKKEAATLQAHSGGVASLAFTRDGRYIASGSFDKTVKIWSFDS